jgi:hypothetical protein
MSGNPSRPWLLRPVIAGYFQIAVAVTLFVTVIVVTVFIHKGSDWHKGIGVAAPEEYDSARYNFLVGYALPSFILIGSVLGTNLLSGRWTTVRVARLQGWLCLIAVCFVSYFLCSEMYAIVVSANYELAKESSGPLKSYTEMHPWNIRLVPRVTDLLTTVSWLQILALSVGLFPAGNWDDETELGDPPNAR